MTKTAKAIKAAMKRKGLRQRDIAIAIGSRSRASEICNGKRAVPRRAIMVLSRLLEIPAEKLLDEAMPEGQISPWLPEQNRIRLAVLGKLIEECNELSARAARCIIHGLNEDDPDTGRPNHYELEREMSDVIACIETAFAIGAMPSKARSTQKIEGFRRWLDLIEASATEKE